MASLALEALGEVNEVWRPPRRDDFGQGTGRPILLLHGFGAPRRILDVLERRLRRTMGVAVMSFHLPGLGGLWGGEPIGDEAQRLGDKLERLCIRHGVEEVDIVGHSKGGLIARHMLSFHPVGRRVRVLVGLGSPFRGAPLAVLGTAVVGLFSRSVWDLAPFSAFMKRLRDAPVPAAARVVSVSGGLDVIAPPALCRLEETTPGNVANHVVPGVGHNSLLMSRRVFEVIVKELQRDRPSVPGKPS